MNRLCSGTYSYQVICHPGGNSLIDQAALVSPPAFISGRQCDLGHFCSTLIFASINLVVCTFLIAQCHEFCQFLLCQGSGIGVNVQKPLLSEYLIANCPLSQISRGLMYGPAMCVIAHWFKERRSTALPLLPQSEARCSCGVP